MELLTPARKCGGFTRWRCLSVYLFVFLSVCLYAFVSVWILLSHSLRGSTCRWGARLIVSSPIHLFAERRAVCQSAQDVRQRVVVERRSSCQSGSPLSAPAHRRLRLQVLRRRRRARSFKGQEEEQGDRVFRIC